MEANIEVICRFRPQNTLEKSMGGTVCVDIGDDDKSCVLNSKQGKNNFTFDHIFGIGSPQVKVYERVGLPIVDDVFKGYNGTIFVYGQTGSGKTFTMMGPNDDLTGFCDDKTMKGLIPRIVESVFDSVDRADPETEFTIQVSYIEIYLEKIRDLLDPTQQNLRIKEDRHNGKGVYIQGATEEYVTSAEEVFILMKEGAGNRTVSATRMNEESSRSHSIFIFTISQKHIVSLESKTGKLFLVDLAGSEKVKKTGAQGKLLEEAKNINKSLSCLGNVINALTDGKSRYIPYRDSKLTRLLQDSLGGNSRTTLIINCSPSTYNDFETLSTLRFGIRAKSIKNKPKVNRELSVKELTILLEKAKAEIAHQKKYIQSLEIELRSLNGGNLTPKVAKQGKIEQEGTFSENRADTTITNESNTDASPTSMAIQPSYSDERLDEIQNQLQLEVVKCEKLTEERDKLKQRYSELTEELESKIEYYREVERDLNSYMNDLRTMNSLKTNEIAELKMALEKVEYEATEKEFTVENLEIRNEALTNEMNALKVQLTELKMKELENKEQLEQSKKSLKDVDEFVEFISDANIDLLTNTETVFSTSELFKTEKKKQRLVKIMSQLKNQLKDLQKAGDDCELDDAKVEKSIEEPSETHIDQSLSTSPLRERTRTLPSIPIITTKPTVNEPTPLSATTPQTPMSTSGVINRLFTSFDKQNQNQTIETLRKELDNAHKKSVLEREMYEKQIISLMNDLSNRCDKVVELEMALDEAKDKYNQLIDNSSVKKTLDKIAFLQRNLQTTTSQLQEMTQQRNSKELELKLMENKLKIRDDRIMNLDQKVQEIISKTNTQTNGYIEKLAEQNKTISNQKAEIEKLNRTLRRIQENSISDEDIMDDDSDTSNISYTSPPPRHSNTHSKIVKPLRGGGGKKREGSSHSSGTEKKISKSRSEDLNSSSISNSSFDSPISLGKVISPEDYFDRTDITQSPEYYAPSKKMSSAKKFSIRDFFFPKSGKNEFSDGSDIGGSDNVKRLEEEPSEKTISERQRSSSRKSRQEKLVNFNGACNDESDYY